MKQGASACHAVSNDRRRTGGERGQILVIFVLAIFAIIGMVGLVLDGGSAFAQRRDEQNVADLASIAGATAYLNTQGDARPRLPPPTRQPAVVATANGYTHGADSVAVDVARRRSHGRRRRSGSTIRSPSQQLRRDSSACRPGTSPSTAHRGERPRRTAPSARCRCSSTRRHSRARSATRTAGPCVPEVYQLPGTGNEDVPQDATQFNWTIFCTASGNPCNANSNGVREHHRRRRRVHDRLARATTSGRSTAGSHTTLFGALESHVGDIFPVPIVNDDGEMVGFAYFKLLVRRRRQREGHPWLLRLPGQRRAARRLPDRARPRSTPASTSSSSPTDPGAGTGPPSIHRPHHSLGLARQPLRRVDRPSGSAELIEPRPFFWDAAHLM